PIINPHRTNGTPMNPFSTSSHVHPPSLPPFSSSSSSPPLPHSPSPHGPLISDLLPHSPASLPQSTPPLLPSSYQYWFSYGETTGSSWIPRWQQTYAAVWKNIKRLINNPAVLAFTFFLPATQIILFCVAIGR